MIRMLFGVLILLTSVLQIKLWTGDNSVQEVSRLKKLVVNQTEELQLLEKRNLALRAEIDNLKLGPLAFEEKARKELGMIKPNETFCLVVSP